jgi:hypothetical protein
MPKPSLAAASRPSMDASPLLGEITSAISLNWSPVNVTYIVNEAWVLSQEMIGALRNHCAQSDYRER